MVELRATHTTGLGLDIFGLPLPELSQVLMTWI